MKFASSIGKVLLVAFAASLGSVSSQSTLSVNTPAEWDSDIAPGAPLGKQLREEGVSRSRAIVFASALSDRIGPRLTGSPNLAKAYAWSQETLRDFGATNVHLEDAGLFGLSWRENNVWMRMTIPDQEPFVVRAAPWSIGSGGAISGAAIEADITSDDDMARYHGKLSGKIVFLGPMRPVPQPTAPFSKRFSDQQIESREAIADVRRFYATRQQRYAKAIQAQRFAINLAHFLSEEKVLAVVLPSRDGAVGGGTGNVTADDTSLSGGHRWLPNEQGSFPILYAQIENFGRVTRLLSSDVPVSIQYDLDTEVLKRDAHLYNVVADIPGDDPTLKSAFVIVGAHIDSWAAGTGATDNGAGVAVALEALRIIKATKVRLRRTIRIVLYSGEEQGLLGSQAYVEQHLGVIPRSAEADDLMFLISSWRKPRGALIKGPDYENLSGAYNIDLGSGRIRGVFTGGNRPLAEIMNTWTASLSDLGISAVFDEPGMPADQSTYTELGIPGIMFLQDPMDYFTRTHHTNMDTVERLVPEDLSQASTVTAAFLIKTANLQQKLPRTSPHDLTRK